MSIGLWIVIVGIITISYFGIFWYGYSYGKEDGRKS